LAQGRRRLTIVMSNRTDLNTKERAMDTRPDVLVVGAGPVGMSAALALVRRGIAPLLVDDGWRPASHTYAVGLHPTSLDLLARLGVDTVLQTRGQRVDGIFLYENGHQREWIGLAELPAEHPFLLAISQAALEEELAAALSATGVRVLWNHRVKTLSGASSPRVELERLEKESTGYGYATSVWVVDKRWSVQPRFVIGADGHASLVRRSLGIELEERGEALRYLAVEVALPNGDAGRALRILLSDDRADAVWPLRDGQCRCSLELPSTQEEEQRFKERALWAPHPAGVEELARFVGDRVPWIGRGSGIGWSGVARFERRLATTYGRDAVWLAGDAAHTTSPLGVQSLNMGLREGIALGEAIADEIQGVRGDALQRYQADFRQEWDLLHGLQSVSARDPWVQAAAPRLIPALPATGPALLHLLRRLGAEVPHVPALAS